MVILEGHLTYNAETWHHEIDGKPIGDSLRRFLAQNIPCVATPSGYDHGNIRVISEPGIIRWEYIDEPRKD